MHLTGRDRKLITGTVTTVREPARPDVPAQADPQVSETVSAMLAEIERDGVPAVRRYAERLDRRGGLRDQRRPARRPDRGPARRPKGGAGRGCGAPPPLRRDAAGAPV